MPTQSDPEAPPEAEPHAAAELNMPMDTATMTAQPRPAVPPRPNDTAFDAWLRRSLIATHDWILQEPVPDRLLQILKNAPRS